MRLIVYNLYNSVKQPRKVINISARTRDAEIFFRPPKQRTKICYGNGKHSKNLSNQANGSQRRVTKSTLALVISSLHPTVFSFLTQPILVFIKCKLFEEETSHDKNLSVKFAAAVLTHSVIAATMDPILKT